MLHWVFTTYRTGPAIFVAVPLTLAALILVLVTASLAGKQATPALKHITLLLVGLSVSHLVLLAAGSLALVRATTLASGLLDQLIFGPAGYDRLRLALGGFSLSLSGSIAVILVDAQLQVGGRLHEWGLHLGQPPRRREELGSAHFCYPADFARLHKAKGDYDLKLHGAFWGKRGRNERAARFYRLDRGEGWLTLSSEDQARGMCLIGPPGTGKSQAGILPVTADAMDAGQSLILLDPQSELLPHVLDLARVTGHQVIVHDPTDTNRPRFNLAASVKTVSDARAVANVLISGGDFWSSAASNLLAACLLRFDTLGDVVRAFDDMAGLAETLISEDDGAANLARAFASSVGASDRSAPGVLATLQASTLSAWADPTVQQATAASDFNAAMLIQQPTVIVLRCPGRYMKVYGPYLGAVLQQFLLDLDELAVASPEGQLPRPVKVVIDEFPVMGKLSSVVEAVNLFRKRRISVLIAAQTLAQFDLIYGRAAAEALIAGLATQVYFGSCDAATAQFVSRSLGRTTERIPQAGRSGPPQVRSRDLMSVDEVISPPEGSCTLIYRYATPDYAAQVVLLSALTYMFQRADWTERIAAAKERGIVPDVMEKPLFERTAGQDLTSQAPIQNGGYE